jgi:hypothetical protein
MVAAPFLSPPKVPGNTSPIVAMVTFPWNSSLRFLKFTACTGKPSLLVKAEEKEALRASIFPMAEDTIAAPLANGRGQQEEQFTAAEVSLVSGCRGRRNQRRVR